MTQPRTDEAYHRYHTGKSYCESIKLALSSPHYPSRELMAYLPLHLLYGFSLELLLKAWLLHAGKPSPEVRKYGHDLTSLLTDAKLEGLPQIAGLDGMVAKNAGPHGDYTYRYLEDGDEYAPVDWAVELGVLDALDTAVGTYIGASAHHGLAPGH